MQDHATFFHELYRLFNARKTDAVLAVLAPDVEWGNGMEGGHVHGREAVRDYWTRQWDMIDPTVEPVNVTEASDGRIVVAVRQHIRDLAGKTLSEGDVRHIYLIKDGLVARMDIEKD